ncbi:MAG: RDD family protein [Gammaproteobacteria bacterium]
MPADPSLNPGPAPGLFRRLAAGFYDTLIVLAIWLLATLIAVIPFTRSHSFESFYAHAPALKILYQIGLLALGYVFFAWFWIHGGQTVGMRAWQLQVVRTDGTPMDWYRALLRYVALLIPWLLLLLSAELFVTSRQLHNALPPRIFAGLVLIAALAGFLWPAFDPQRLGWQDRLSRSRLLHAPRRSS